MDNGTRHLAYHEYRKREIAESLSVKLGFDIKVIRVAEEEEEEADAVRPLLGAIL